MRSKKKYLIDGRFLNSMTTGIDRYAYWRVWIKSVKDQILPF